MAVIYKDKMKETRIVHVNGAAIVAADSNILMCSIRSRISLDRRSAYDAGMACGGVRPHDYTF